MLNICIIAHNRPRLLRQCIESLVWHTITPANITVIDDGSGPETKELLQEFDSRGCWSFSLFRNERSVGPGRARNQSIELSQVRWGRGNLLYLIDSDSYHLFGWDKTLLEVWNSDVRRGMGFEAIGGYCHPFQQPISQMRATTEHSIAELEALGLFSWLMEWETFDKYGPFLPAATVNGSEDWAFSQRIRLGGGKVGVVMPQLAINCGVTSSDGKPCPGAALLYQQKIPVGVVIE